MDASLRWHDEEFQGRAFRPHADTGFLRIRSRYTPITLMTNRMMFCVPIPCALSLRKPQLTSAMDEVTKITKAQPVGRRPRSSETISAAVAPAIEPYHSS